jgi:uncharacterized protein YndB with AHSA1/START domain
METKHDFTASVTVTVRASPSKVWQALTDPKLIKEYLFNTDAASDWKEGSSITWTGSYEGKSYIDKGVILKFKTGELLKYTYFSSMSSKADLPENYAVITCGLKTVDGQTVLTLSQDHNDSKEAQENSAKNWETVLLKLKSIAEKL